MLKRNTLLNLVVFSTDPWVILIPMRVKLRKRLQTLFVLAMVNEPTRRLLSD